MSTSLLLESYLKALRLPGFLRNYRKLAEDATRAGLSYDRYLFSMVERRSPNGRGM
jgi:hypothetical protein